VLNFVKLFFGGYRSASRALSYQPYFRAFRFLWSSPPRIYRDLPTNELEAINANSKQYFENEQNRDFWLNKPFSDPEWAPWFLWRFGLLLDGLQIRKGDRVLDFGCGTGWTSLMLAKMGAEVTGMDIAPAALEIAKEAGSAMANLRFLEFPGERIPAENESFDFVILFEAFHHLPNRLTILNEIYRVLSPHGILGFAEPGVGHSQGEIAHAELEKGVLEQDIDLEQLYRSALSSGFQDLEILVPPVTPKNLTLPIRRLRWYLRGLSFLLSADQFRAAILTGPIGLIRKSPYRSTSLHSHNLRASIRPATKFLEVRAGSEFEIAAEIRNCAETVWLAAGRNGAGYVRLGAQLKQCDGKLLEQDYGRSKLPADLRKGERAKVILKLNAPRTPGQYVLLLDMVNEGICWFHQRGSPPVELLLTVQSPL
jgi:SAM-dependent methyltransferase